jgi:hypothetical protein
MALYQTGRIGLGICLSLGSRNHAKSHIKLYLDKHARGLSTHWTTSVSPRLTSVKSAVGVKWL